MLKWLLANSLWFLGSALCFLFVCGLLFAATFSASNQKCQTDRATEYAQKYKPDFGEMVTSFFVCQGVTIDENGELLTALGTLAIAAFTLTLWLTSRDQGHLTREAINEAKLSSQRQLRAYVSVTPSKAFIKDGEFCGIVRLENTGNTPAFETRCLWNMKVGLLPGKRELVFNFSNPSDEPIPTFVLYPKATHSAVSSVKLTEDDLAGMKAGTHVIRAFGMVQYTDAFKEPQWGTFHCYIDWPGYQMFLYNYRLQPPEVMRPVEAPFKFTQESNRASFN